MNESECLHQVTATTLGVGSGAGTVPSATADAADGSPGSPSLELQHDAEARQCAITLTCVECVLQAGAAATLHVPWNTQLMEWSVASSSRRAHSHVNGTALPQAGGLLTGVTALEVAWVPSFLVVEGDGGVGKAQATGHLLHFRSGHAQQIAATAAGVVSPPPHLQLKFTFPIADVAHTTVVSTEQPGELRAVVIVVVLTSMLSAARFLYAQFEAAFDALEARRRQRQAAQPPPRRRRCRCKCLRRCKRKMRRCHRKQQ